MTHANAVHDANVEDDPVGEQQTRRWRAIGCLALISACLAVLGVIVGGWAAIALIGIAWALIAAALIDND